MTEHSIARADVKNWEAAKRLRANGFSPLPIRMDKKRPRGDGWSRYCVTPRTAAEIDAHWYQHPWDGVGVCGGYSGLVLIDIDTDDRPIIERVLSVLPPVRVARLGSKGLVAFFLAPPGTVIGSKRLKGLDRRALVEILADGRQALVPPTIHPTTRRPYVWTSAERCSQSRAPSSLFSIPLIWNQSCAASSLNSFFLSGSVRIRRASLEGARN